MDINDRRGSYIHAGSRRSEWRRFFDLAVALVVREFKGQYRRSILGPTWAVLQPLAFMLIFIFLRGVLDISSGEIPYPIFVFSALVPWTFFSNAIMRAAPSVYINSGIVKKIAVAREVFPLSAVLVSLVDFLIAALVLVAMMIWFDIPITSALLWLPLLIILTTLLALGIGFVVAAMGTFKRDIIFAIPFLMQFWLLASPVMYPASRVPEQWRFLFDLNPMVGLIEGFRNVLVLGMAPDLNLLLVAGVATLIVWLLAWPLFRLVSQYAADVL